MADLTAARPVRQGILTMDPRITPDSLWVAESTSMSQAGPQPGVPEPQRATRAVLTSSGTQAASTGLRILAHDTGSVWRGSADATTKYRGWNPPSVLTGWEAVRYLDGSSLSEISANYPHACTMADGRVVVVYQTYQTTPSTQDVIQCSTRTPDTGAWVAATEVEAQGAVYSTGRKGHPTVCVLPDGRLLCCYLVEPSTDSVQVRTAYSDDSGATWTTASKAALSGGVIPYQVSGTPRTVGVVSEFTRMRMAYKDGQILLIICARESDTDPAAATASTVQCRDVLRQYASYDLGLSFQEIAIGATNLPGYTGRYADICVSGGYFWISYVACYDTAGVSDAHTRVIKLGSAGQRFDRSETTFVWTGVTGTITTFAGAVNTVRRLTGGDGAIVGADDGIVYILDRQPATNRCYVTQTADQGRTWETMGYPGANTVLDVYATWWANFIGLNHYPADFCATWQRGRALALHSWVAATGNEDNSIGCAYLGGYTTVTNPHAMGVGLAAPVATVDSTWLPFERPGDAQYTAAGAGTDSLTGGALRVTTAANNRNFNLDFSAYGGIASGFIVRGSLTIVTGGSLTANEHAVQIRMADGVSDYDVVLRFATTGVRAYDNNAAATLDSTTITLTAGCDFLIFFGGGGRFRSWVRVRTLSEDGDWTIGPVGTATNDSATPNATHLLSWGSLATCTASADWYEVHLTGNAGSTFPAIAEAAQGTINPTDLYPRRWWPDPVYVDGGTSIALRGGPAFPGDSWSIDTRYLYSTDRMFPSVYASPLVGWRSLADSVDMYIALDLDTGLTANSYPECDTIGMLIMGANWRLGELQGYTGGAWSTIGAIDAASGLTGAKFQSLDATRLGNTLRPSSSASNKPWFDLDELVGWTVDMAGTTKRRIIGNSAGAWDSTSSGQRPTIIMEGVEAGDPAAPSIRLYPPDFVHTFNLLGANYSGYRLKITSQATVDGYYTIGSFLLGPVLFHGYENAWGSSVELEDLTEGDERADGTLSTRSMGKPRRVFEFGWDEVDQTRSSTAAAAPDYYNASSTAGALPLASPSSTVRAMVGLYRRLLGRHTLACALRRVPVGSTGDDVKTINRWEEFVYGRITSPLRVANVLGQTGTDEAVRLSSVTLTEER